LFSEYAGENGFDVALVGDVAGRVRRDAVCGEHFLNYFSAGCRIYIQDMNSGPAGCEAMNDGAPDSTAASGYDGGFSVEAK
jgi:hypothetical protein